MKSLQSKDNHNKYFSLSEKDNFFQTFESNNKVEQKYILR